MLLLLLGGMAAPGLGWKGASLEVDASGPIAVLRAGAQRIPPAWIVIDGNGANRSGIAPVDQRLLLGAADAGIGLFEIETNREGGSSKPWNATHPMSAKALASWRAVLAAAPTQLVILRVVLDEIVDERVMVQDSRDGRLFAAEYNTPASPLWIRRACEKLRAHMEYMDGLFPGRIAGVHLAAMHTQEWYYPGWDARGHFEHQFADYSSFANQSYCAGRAGCTPPSARQRDTPVVGNAFVDQPSAAYNLQASRQNRTAHCPRLCARPARTARPTDPCRAALAQHGGGGGGDRTHRQGRQRRPRADDPLLPT